MFGKNVNDNHSETIHCGNHSRILNCLFDGRGNEDNDCIAKLNADVIDLFNGHDIVIDGCTFIGYEAESRDAGINMITVKSHYRSTLECTEDDKAAGSVNSDCLGEAQNGVVIRNCYFDLPNYIADIIEPWNGVVYGTGEAPVESREFNRQFTLIENNYVYAPKAICLVNCFGFSDYLAVCGNVGTIEFLVLVNDNYPGVGEENDDKNIAHNLVIKDNILRFQVGDPTPGMTILFGSHIDNLELTGNKVDGYLWNGLNNDSVLNLSGTIRICNNETIGPRGLFMDTGGIVMPDDLIIFFSGNISKGVNTDVGSLSVANDPSAGLKFVGRQFFCTSSPYKNQLIIYNGKSWASIITKGVDS